MAWLLVFDVEASMGVDQMAGVFKTKKDVDDYLRRISGYSSDELVDLYGLALRYDDMEDLSDHELDRLREAEEWLFTGQDMDSGAVVSPFFLEQMKYGEVKMIHGQGSYT